MRRRINPAYWMVLPVTAGTLVFAVYPMIASLVASLFEIDIPAGRLDFVGAGNYLRMLGSPDFLLVLANTLVYTLVLVSGSVVLGLLLAVWLGGKGRRYDLVLTIVFAPHVTALVSIAILWMWLFDADRGLINAVLALFGIPGPLWLVTPGTSLLAVMTVGLWKILGYNTLILVAGLQMIPRPVYEAARIDGSGPGRTLVSIVIPQLSPSLFLVFITTTITAFGTFDSVAVMTRGGPLNSSNILAHWIYQTGFQYFRLGEAMAGSVFLIVLVGVVSLANFRAVARRVHYQ